MARRPDVGRAPRVRAQRHIGDRLAWFGAPVGRLEEGGDLGDLGRQVGTQRRVPGRVGIAVLPGAVVPGADLDPHGGVDGQEPGDGAGGGAGVHPARPMEGGNRAGLQLGDEVAEIGAGPAGRGQVVAADDAVHQFEKTGVAVVVGQGGAIERAVVPVDESVRLALRRLAHGGRKVGIVVVAAVQGRGQLAPDLGEDVVGDAAGEQQVFIEVEVREAGRHRDQRRMAVDLGELAGVAAVGDARAEQPPVRPGLGNDPVEDLGVVAHLLAALAPGAASERRAGSADIDGDDGEAVAGEFQGLAGRGRAHGGRGGAAVAGEVDHGRAADRLETGRAEHLDGQAHAVAHGDVAGIGIELRLRRHSWSLPLAPTDPRRPIG